MPGVDQGDGQSGVEQCVQKRPFVAAGGFDDDGCWPGFAKQIDDRTGSVTTDSSFWALVIGISPDGQRYTFVRVYVTAANDSAADFKLANGPNYTIIGEEPEQGLARESNGARGVPTYSVVRIDFCGYDADETPNFIFQWIGPTDTTYLPPHDHRDNFNGGFAFACYHPGTGLPQQPWSQ